MRAPPTRARRTSRSGTASRTTCGRCRTARSPTSGTRRCAISARSATASARTSAGRPGTRCAARCCWCAATRATFSLRRPPTGWWPATPTSASPSCRTAGTASRLTGPRACSTRSAHGSPRPSPARARARLEPGPARARARGLARLPGAPRQARCGQLRRVQERGRAVQVERGQRRGRRGVPAGQRRQVPRLLDEPQHRGVIEDLAAHVVGPGVGRDDHRGNPEPIAVETAGRRRRPRSQRCRCRRAAAGRPGARPACTDAAPFDVVGRRQRPAAGRGRSSRRARRRARSAACAASPCRA